MKKSFLILGVLISLLAVSSAAQAPPPSQISFISIAGNWHDPTDNVPGSQPGEPAITIPSAALVTFAGIEKVFTIADGKAQERVIATGRRGDDWIEATVNLKAGERVILNPGSLQYGQPVTALDSPPPVVNGSNTTQVARPAEPSS